MAGGPPAPGPVATSAAGIARTRCHVGGPASPGHAASQAPGPRPDTREPSCYPPSAADPWCSGPTCQPVTLEIAGSNPVGSAISTAHLEPRPPPGRGSFVSAAPSASAHGHAAAPLGQACRSLGGASSARVTGRQGHSPRQERRPGGRRGIASGSLIGQPCPGPSPATPAGPWCTIASAYERRSYLQAFGARMRPTGWSQGAARASALDVEAGAHRWLQSRPTIGLVCAAFGHWLARR